VNLIYAGPSETLLSPVTGLSAISARPAGLYSRRWENLFTTGPFIGSADTAAFACRQVVLDDKKVKELDKLERS